MKFKIEGMNCDACVTLISIDLDDIGISGFQLKKDDGILKVDDTYKNRKKDIIKAVSTSGDYTAIEVSK